MNARDRIAKAIWIQQVGISSKEAEAWEVAGDDGKAGWWQTADAVLAVLPDLLTDPHLIKAVAHQIDISWMHVQDVLMATAQTITGGTP